MSGHMSLRDEARAVSTNAPSVEKHPLADIKPALQPVTVWSLPAERTMSHIFYFMQMMLAYMLSAQSQESALSGLFSLVCLIFAKPVDLKKLIDGKMAVKLHIIHLTWRTPGTPVVADGAGPAYLSLTCPDEVAAASWSKIEAAILKVLDRVFPKFGVLEIIPAHARPFLMRQVMFAFAKATSARETAIDWAFGKISALADGVRTDAPQSVMMSKEVVTVLVRVFSQNLLSRQLIVEVMVYTMTAQLTDDVMKTIAAQAMYLRNVGLTPLQVTMKYAILAGYPEIEEEKGLGGEYRAFIDARTQLIRGGVRAAFMYYVNDHNTVLMHPNNFPRLFSFAMGAGRVEEDSLTGYTTSFNLMTTWVDMGAAAAQKRKEKAPPSES